MSRSNDTTGSGEAVPPEMRALKVPPQHLELFAVAIAQKILADAERVKETACDLTQALCRNKELEPMTRRGLHEWLGSLDSSARMLVDFRRRAAAGKPRSEVVLSAPVEELVASLEVMAREVIEPRLAGLLNPGPIPTEAAQELIPALAWALEQGGTMEEVAAAEREAARKAAGW